MGEMASGYFPATKRDDFGKRLCEAINILDKVVSEWYDYRGDLVPEDVGYDTTYIDTLEAAKSQIKSCIRMDASCQNEVAEQIAKLKKEQAETDKSIIYLNGVLEKLKQKESP